MITLEKEEASRPGEAFEPKNNDKIHDEDIRVLDSSKADTASTINVVDPSKSSNQSNALLIIPSKGAESALWALKAELREGRCRYTKTPPYRGWIAPIGSKQLVEDLLTKKGVKFSVKPIWDEYQEKNKFAQTADRTWERIEVLEQQLFEDESHLLV